MILRIHLIFIILCIPILGLSQTYIDTYKGSRYTIKKSDKTKAPRAIASDASEVDKFTVKLKSITPTNVGTQPPSQQKESKISIVQEGITPVPNNQKPATNEPIETSEPKLGEHIQGIFNSHTNDIYKYYLENVENEDSRKNRFEFDLYTNFSYLNSDSKYSYRKYNSAYHSLTIKPSLWITPLIGFQFLHQFSLSADIEVTSGNSRSFTKFEHTQLGLTFRDYFNLSALSPVIEYGIVYFESKLTVPSDDISRNRLRSSGIGIQLATRIPSDSKTSWKYGAILFPRSQHKEEETSIAIRSGSSSNNIRLDLEILGEYKMNRQNQLIFGIQYISEKNYFDGISALPDSVTGQTQTNVSVTHTSTQFLFGYRWGK